MSRLGELVGNVYILVMIGALGLVLIGLVVLLATGGG
jgi:hypothetical protein